MWLLVNTDIHANIGLAFPRLLVTEPPPPCSRLQMTTSTKIGLDFDRWILDGQKPIEAWNLFTEKWSLLSFYAFNFSSYSTPATERTTTAIKIIFLCCVLYIWVLVEESVATGISAMAVFVSFNGGHNYFKFQSYGTVTHKINVHNLLNSFLTVNEKDKF